KKEIYDADVEALAEAQIHAGPALWTLEAVTCNGGSGTIPSAAGCLWDRDRTPVRGARRGGGPLGAGVQTVGPGPRLPGRPRDLPVRGGRVGEAAQGEGWVEVEYNGRLQRGQGVSPDIIEASALAFLQAINRLAIRRQPRLNPQTESVGVS